MKSLYYWYCKKCNTWTNNNTWNCPNCGDSTNTFACIDAKEEKMKYVGLEDLCAKCSKRFVCYTSSRDELINMSPIRWERL